MKVFIILLAILTHLVTDSAKITSNIALFIREVHAVYKRVRADFVLPSVPITVGPPKSADLAETYRFRGLQLMHESCDDEEKRNPSTEAIEMFTRSVALSLENSRALAMAYADRSTVFFEVGQFESCLFDINRALMNENCPTSLESILLDRKRKCLSQIKQLRDEAGTWYTIMSENEDETDPIYNPYNIPCVRWSDEFDNPRIPDTSSKIELRYNKTWGRHMVAAKDINAGDILSSEQFFSFGVPPDGRYTFNYQTKETTHSKWEECNMGCYDHCSHCGKRCKGLIPCPSCTAFLFCSEDCREHAYDSYHRTECRMGALYWLGDRVCSLPYFLAVRTLLVGTEQGAKLGELMERLTIQKIFDAKLDIRNVMFENYYEALLKLSTTVDQSLIRSRMEDAVQVVIVLRSLGFFEGVTKHFQRQDHRDAERFSHAEVFVVALLLKHFNTEKMYEFLEPKDYTLIGELICPADPIILGTLVLHALINHACDSNADVFVSKGQHVLYAKRPIKKGQQISISYYGDSYMEPIKEGCPGRLAVPFTCRCEACTQDWPLLNELIDTEPIIETVARTDESTFLRTFEGLVEPILKPERELSASEIREIMCRIVTLFQKYIRRPASSHMVFDFYISLYTRLLYDEVVQKVERVLRYNKDVKRHPFEASTNKIVTHTFALDCKLWSFAKKYIKKTRV